MCVETYERGTSGRGMTYGCVNAWECRWGWMDVRRCDCVDGEVRIPRQTTEVELAFNTEGS